MKLVTIASAGMGNGDRGNAAAIASARRCRSLDYRPLQILTNPNMVVIGQIGRARARL